MKIHSTMRLFALIAACGLAAAVVLGTSLGPGHVSSATVQGTGNQAAPAAAQGASSVAVATSTPAPAATSAARPASASSTLVVTGTGTIFVAVDMATVTFGVQRQAASAQQAQNAIMAVLNRVMSRLHTLGVSDRDIQTSYVGLSPRVSGGHITGYQAAYFVQVMVHGLKMVGNIVDAAVYSGADRNVNITYGLSNGNAAHMEALRAAVLEAKMRALTVASALARDISVAHVQELTEPEVVSWPISERVAPYLGPTALNNSNVFYGTMRVSETVKLIYTF